MHQCYWHLHPAMSRPPATKMTNTLTPRRFLKHQIIVVTSTSPEHHKCSTTVQQATAPQQQRKHSRGWRSDAMSSWTWYNTGGSRSTPTVHQCLHGGSLWVAEHQCNKEPKINTRHVRTLCTSSRCDGARYTTTRARVQTKGRRPAHRSPMQSGLQDLREGSTIRSC